MHTRRNPVGRFFTSVLGNPSDLHLSKSSGAGSLKSLVLTMDFKTDSLITNLNNHTTDSRYGQQD
jgi:hypothetical protein